MIAAIAEAAKKAATSAAGRSGQRTRSRSTTGGGGGGGGGDLLSTNNLSDVASAATARTNLGLAIGTNVQAWDAQLDSLSSASANGVSLVVAADYAAMKALLDLEIGTDVQAYNARLADVAGASWAQGDVMYHNGSNLVRLPAGTSGYFLKTLGAGANPEWAASSGAVATDAIWDAKGDLAVGTGANTASVLGVGSNGQVLSADSGEATGLKWITVAGTGDVTAASSFGTDNVVIRADGTGKGVQSSLVSISDNADITAYDATNDGNPVFAYGASATERLRIVPTYDTGAQTIDYVLFTTDVASATADKGLFRFSPDGSAVLDIDDGGINFAASMGISIAGTNIITDSAGTATLSNIDALDATTEATIEAAIDTLANLTSIQGRTVTLADAGVNAIFGWDDAAGAYENLTAAEAKAIVGLPTSTTDNTLPRFDGTGGNLQTSSVVVDDSNNISGIVNLTQTGYYDLTEISAPSSPSANVARVYAVDSQSKTVPFWKDSAGVASALDIRTGWVQMYRTADAGADPSANPATWVVRAPDGSYVSTSGTTTQGTQEAFNYCRDYGYNLFVNGGGGINSSDIDVATIHCTSGIDVPPMFKQAFVARGVTFNFGGSATYGFKLDSIMMGLFDTRSCQIVVGTSTYETGVWLRPRTANAVDPAIAITASDLLFGSIVHGKSTSVGLLIDPTEGPILDGVFIEVHEPNGKGASGSDTAAYGVRILDHATNVVKGTTMRVLDSHGHTTASVAIGSSTTNGANIHSNHFDIHCDPGASGIGVDLYGAYNSIIARINDDEGTATTGINIRSSAVYNLISAPRLEASTKISDASAGFTNLIEGEGVRYGGSFYIGTLSSISTVAGSGGSVASRIQFHSTGADSAVTTWRWSADAAGPRVIMSKSRGASVGTQTVVQSGDVLGEIVFAGSDGTDMEPGAAIRAEVNATPGAGDMPAKIVFSTTSDGAEAVTDRVAIDSSGLSVGDVALTPHIAQNSQSAAYTLVLSDAQKQIYHPGSDNNARTFTIPANSSVAYPIGTCLTFINAINTVTIAITSDTLTLAGSGSSGSRTLAANGWATAVKVASTSWMISGVGLT